MTFEILTYPTVAAGPRTSLLQRFIAAIVRWDTRNRQLHALRHLDPHLLRDIGLTKADVARETRWLI